MINPQFHLWENKQNKIKLINNYLDNSLGEKEKSEFDELIAKKEIDREEMEDLDMIVKYTLGRRPRTSIYSAAGRIIIP